MKVDSVTCHEERSEKKGKRSIKIIAIYNKDAFQADLPPELVELRKEARKKQRELNALRKKWWNDRKDVKGMPGTRPLNSFK